MAEEREVHLTKNVFVAGASPSITYNPRDDRHLEQELTAYLEQGPGRALSVSGPTKSGKTVLVERALPRDEAIWVAGQDLHSVEVFWDRIVDWLGLYDLVEVTRQETDEKGKELGMDVGVPKLASINAKKKDGASVAKGVRKSRTQAVTSVARAALEEVNVPVVIDDFHYVDEDARQEMARAIKSVIPFTKVILIAVPHEAFDVVRNEADMGGRLSQLRIELWSVDELRFIAERGFDALNIEDQHSVGDKLARASYGAPFLMQDLCYQYAVILGVVKTADDPVAAVAPKWKDFFARIANRTPPVIFDHLLKGPKTRGQRRVPRVFKTGVSTDVYGALLYGIARAGKASVTYQQLARVIERDFTEAIAGQQITASLGHMATVALENRGTGDPAVAYKDDVLHVVDPFLLFYLRHGTWDVGKDMEEQGELGDDGASEVA
ncbi:MAG: hypothetical protein QOG35_3180 [Solirubrobacteraceae bacterium]|jgi:hypothetical protein|nr:hypothetical protein [Solirubrobacteraceae bacterium]